ncbi:phosphate ABC transporter substrate-binding/OmpA family protein [Puniceibacterium sp. IMCC21224]|uniref:phosphate ABC transporter substrate-binding/OmpA family protein n=1 Tax=Puniceibacterium sp. IMCC21224 TaxID=1618204 RepID=UPI00064DC0AC|nr:phosphate ABC transporter substrate-binding/OmpA family protein [Puniceibacterium sp. IMCC21224]KMK65937.1 phosphate ABC transporter substrate-binding protein, PhoT family [Puniceibacterium sp. IMCC21224]
MRYICAAVFAALFLWGGGSPALAQDVTLRSPDGAIELTGTLLGFDGDFYRVATQYGELTVDGSGVLCEGPGCPSLTNYVAELTISGSDSAGAILMPALVGGFALRNNLTAQRETQDAERFTYLLRDPATDTLVGRFSFRVTNTDEGFADLLADEADIVMAVREIRPSEVRLARDAGLGNLLGDNRSRVLALDALVPVVAAGNPIESLTLDDLTRVVDGTLRNWRDLGGPDAPVVLHLRNARSGLSQGVEDRLLHSGRGDLRDDVMRHTSNAALAKAVSDDPFGIGFASFSELGNSKPLILTGQCGFDLRSTRRNIKTEDYPLTAPMFLYIPARRLPKLARDFLSFTRSGPAQIVIRRAGFVDQSPEVVPLDLQGDRLTNAIRTADGISGLTELKRMVNVLGPMRRLTTSFRFETGSARLDAQSRSNVQQLARALEDGVYDAHRIVFVGFSDGEGPADANLEIARKRADTVRTAVQIAAETADFDAVNLNIEAFGEAMPMACDDTDWGRQVNRRVEVWLR